MTTDTEALVDAMLPHLVPYVQAAISTAVAEAVRRAAVTVPMDGALAEIEGATGFVAVPDQEELVPCTLANSALGVGDHVVIIFYGHGITYAHGPIAGPPPPI